MAMHPDELAALIDALNGTKRGSGTRRVVSRRLKRPLKDGGTT